MDRLNFPDYNLENRIDAQKKGIFDLVRKKIIPLTPEEWVRQHCIELLIQQYNIPIGRISVEQGLKYQSLQKRFDILTLDSSGSAQILVECKAPDVELTEKTLLQAGVYNSKLDSRYIWITNGKNHIWMKRSNEKFEYLAFPKKIDQ